MPIDAGIYGQLQQQPQQTNPLASLAQAYQIKAYQGAIDKSDRAEQQQNRLLSLVQGPEFQKLDAQGRANALQGLGDFDNAGKVITSAAAANKDQRAADQTGLDMAIKRHEAMSGAMMGLAQDPSQARQVIGQLVQAQIMAPEYGQKILQSAAQAQDPSAFFKQGAMAAVSAKDQLAQRIQQNAQGVTMRGQDMTAATARAGQDVTVRGQDLTDARSRETAQNGRVPTGYRLAADGQTLEFIPGGPADPSAAKKASPTEFQGKSAIFGSRAQEADKILSALGTEYSPAGINTKNAVGSTPLIGGALEAGANVMLSKESQKAEQAQRDFVNAVLRLESGAAIGKDEFQNAKRQYFPQPGDSAEVIAQKAANRKLQIEGLLGNAGNAPIPKGQTAEAKPGAVMAVTDAASYAKVPSGTTYTTPDGKTRRKP